MGLTTVLLRQYYLSALLRRQYALQLRQCLFPAALLGCGTEVHGQGGLLGSASDSSLLLTGVNYRARFRFTAAGKSAPMLH